MPLDDRALDSLLDLVFDHACARPLSDFVDADRVLGFVDDMATVERLAQAQQRHWRPMSERLLARAGASKVTLGAWLPASVAEKLSELAGKPAPIPRKVIDELVASEKVRDEVRTMLQETLTSFIKKASATQAAGPAAGLRGALGFGARAVASAGKGLLGGIGDEIQRQLQDRVRDFVDASVEAVQERIARKLASDETAASLGKRRRKWLLDTLARTEAEVTEGLREKQRHEIEALLPAIIQHNAARPELREAIVAEVRASLEELSRQSIGEALDELGIRARSREALKAHGLPFARSLAETPGFQAWLAAAREA
jgi:hypothetical protein